MFQLTFRPVQSSTNALPPEPNAAPRRTPRFHGRDVRGAVRFGLDPVAPEEPLTVEDVKADICAEVRRPGREG